MGIHIAGNPGDVADLVLLPGDPIRARYIAEKYLDDVQCYSVIRGMFGFTGTFRGRKVSVQGTGMGSPSMAIYAYELIHDFKVKTLIRVGSCGALQTHVKIRDVLIALAASTDSAINSHLFCGQAFAPTADYDLLEKARKMAKKLGILHHVGTVLTTDTFYQVDDLQYLKPWIEHRILGVEMETAALYTMAARWRVQALALLTVSDHIHTKESISPAEREMSLDPMIELALAMVH